MDRNQGIDWADEQNQLSKIQIQGNLDESDAHLYEQMIKGMTPEKQKKSKKKMDFSKKAEKPQKISEYY